MEPSSLEHPNTPSSAPRERGQDLSAVSERVGGQIERTTVVSETPSKAPSSRAPQSGRNTGQGQANRGSKKALPKIPQTAEQYREALELYDRRQILTHREKLDKIRGTSTPSTAYHMTDQIIKIRKLYHDLSTLVTMSLDNLKKLYSSIFLSSK